MISEIINLNAVDMNLTAKDKREAIHKICNMLFQDGSITSKEDFQADVFLRESQGQTGIGQGIAIPHGKSEAVSKTCISIVKLTKGIKWETIDGQDVRLIILFAVKLEDKNTYFVKLMSQVARLIARDEFCEALMTCNSKEELMKLFSESAI
jgi:fructose PTS system EIIA component